MILIPLLLVLILWAILSPGSLRGFFKGMLLLIALAYIWVASTPDAPTATTTHWSTP